MSYFKNFPYVRYPFPDNVKRDFKNISLRPTIHEDVYDAQNLEGYLVKDDETPETIAYDHYGEVEMHWIIMLVNNVMNLYTDWPKSTGHFEDYIFYKYKNVLDDNGVDTRTLSRAEVLERTQFVGTPDDAYLSKITRINEPEFSVTIFPPYFEDVDGTLFSYDSMFATKDVHGNTLVQEEMVPVSYYEWESRLNEKKKEIWIPSVNLARRMQKQLKDMMND